MPELPEVEVLRCHLEPLLVGKQVSGFQVLKPRVVRPETPQQLENGVAGCSIKGVGRKGKFLWLDLAKARSRTTFHLTIHLGMTGRLFVQDSGDPLPGHTAAVLGLGRKRLVFRDPRSFGRVTLETDSLDQLGVDALSDEFLVERLRDALASTGQAVKVRLMDQRHIAGLGNIYVCEVLHLARVSPFEAASKLPLGKVKALHQAIRNTLQKQVELGLKLNLDFAGEGKSDGLFYFGSASTQAPQSRERFRVYGREGEACPTCGSKIVRAEQSKRGTFFCPQCQQRE